jgi:hypothetical protein
MQNRSQAIESRIRKCGAGFEPFSDFCFAIKSSLCFAFEEAVHQMLHIYVLPIIELGYELTWRCIVMEITLKILVDRTFEYPPGFTKLGQKKTFV